MSIGKTIFSVTSVTLFSRFIGLVSMQMYISKFGFDNIYLQIFTYALLLPNTIFTAIGTLLTTVVIPIYSALISKNQLTTANYFLNNIITISSLVILLLILIGFFSAPILVSISGFNEPDYFETTVTYIRILLPVLFFFGLSYIFQGILQSQGKYNIVAIITLPSSFIIIIYMIFLSNKFGVMGLLICNLIALSSQAIFLLPSVIKTGYKYKISFGFKDENIINCFKMIIPVLIGVSSFQINTVFIGIIGTQFNISQIQFAQNIMLVTILSFVYSITAIYYPKLSVYWAKNEHTNYKNSIINAMSILIVLLMPATFGFIGIRYSFFEALAYYGKVTNDDIIILGNLLALFSLGIVSIGLKELIDRCFYAQKNTLISGYIGFLIMILNVIFNFLLLGLLNIYSIPVSYVLSVGIGVSILFVMLRIKIGSFNKQILKTSIKSLLASLVMLFVIYLENKYLANISNTTFFYRLIKLFIPVLTGGVIYFLIAYFLKIDCIIAPTNKIIKKLKFIKLYD